MKTADTTLLNDADFAVQVTPERVETPSMRWRNKWHFLYYSTCADCGVKYQPGEVRFDCCAGPFISPVDAEVSAEVDLKWQWDHEGEENAIWLGAFPIEGDA